MPKKLVVWDGDETLWNGTILNGDTPTLPPGRLELCDRLYNMGVVQSVASKNTPQDVERTLHILGLTRYFLANQASLETPKYEMIRTIMDELGLASYDDVLFIDDDPFNTAEAQERLGVDTWNNVDETLLLNTCGKAVYTKEDRDRVEMYRSELLRREVGKAYANDRTAFLKSCEMRANIRKATESDMERVVSLVERAHRLSAAYKPYSQSSLELMRKLGELWVMDASDKFGSYGLSGVVRAFRDPGSTILMITLFTISCRLQGKGYGSALLGHMVNLAQSEVRAMWVETEYNGGVRALYDWYKFTISKDKDNVCEARLPTTQVSLPSWISITSG